MDINKPVKEIVKTFFDSYPLVHYAKQEVLLRPDESLSHIFYLIEGQIVEYDISAVGNEIVINAFKSGAFFPMSQAINRTRNDYFFETAIKSTVRKAPVNEVLSFIQENPVVCYDLLSRVYLGTDGLLRRMAHMMGGKARSRLVFELLNGAARFGEKRMGKSVHLPMTEKDIAKRSGLSRETVNRTLHTLKNEGLVSVSAGGIYIPDIDKLSNVIENQL
jgi:CRP-like cAMP-binding protein